MMGSIENYYVQIRVALLMNIVSNAGINALDLRLAFAAMLARIVCKSYCYSTASCRRDS
jgi:hypothetical protein